MNVKKSHPYYEERKELRNELRNYPMVKWECPGCGEEMESDRRSIALLLTRNESALFACASCYATADLGHISPTGVEPMQVAP